MIGQRKISSFFKVVAAKRPLNVETSTQPDQGSTPPKKLKSTEEGGTSREAKPNSLSPEQQQRMALQREKALQRLQEKTGEQTAVGSAPAGMGETWARALSPQFKKPYFQKLQKFVEAERSSRTIYPPANEVFSWTQLCPIDDVKVVILGQDPYHGPGQAHGLCFSVKKGVAPPPSLGNMYKELATDIEGFKQPSHGELTEWAKQGVLLLNAVLTVRAHQANSHKDQGWETLTDAVIAWLNQHGDGVIFLLWGSYAQKKGRIINTKRHHILKSVHPSPLSAYRGFFGCKHFSKANEILRQAGKRPIDWGKLEAE